ncbi:MAG: hypothetical protein IJH95_05225 [Mogibacterium sp.]|nr:hypothetical protein [Mogibacterium sp.]
MPVFKVVEGRLSEHYNHFREYEFESCRATATRLMGVVAMKISWKGRADQRARFFQVLHLDYSEYGIDDYREFECIPGKEDYGDKKQEMTSLWNHFISVMGGSVVSLSAPVMLRLIEMALPLAGDDISREYDSEENIIFRHEALLRLSLMKDALEEHGINASDGEPESIISTVSPKRLATCETINYFVMRLVDCDIDAASYLSTISRDELSLSELTRPGVQTLMRSSIRKSSAAEDLPSDGSSFPYRVRITTMSRSGYHHSSFIIFLDRDYRSRDARVTELRLGTTTKMSDFESAMQISRSEYITVFDVPDKILNGFDGRYISTLADTDPVAVPNGWLYTVYNKNNSHVNKTEYRLGDDVFGYALLTIGGELILMSNKLDNIGNFEDSVVLSMYASFLIIKGRYLLDTPVFHTLCHRHAVLFEDLIETDDN